MVKRKRQLLVLAVSVLCLGAAGYGAARLIQPNHRINRATHQQIEEGMTRQEVEDLLGVPPGNYTTGRELFSVSDFINSETGARTRPPGDLWQSDHGEIRVCFDDDDKVSRSTFY